MKNLNRNTIVLLVFSLAIMLSTPMFGQNGKGQKQGKEKKEMLKAKEQDIKRKQNQLKGEKKELKNEAKALRDETKEVKQELKGQKKELKKKVGDSDRGSKLRKDSDQKSGQKADKGKMNREEKERIDREYDKNKKEKPTNSAKDKKENGKNKEGLSGREFGQKRAEEARSKHEKIKKDYEHSVGVAEERSKIGRVKIAEADKKLEAAKKLKTISEEDYQLKKEKISRAREALNGLEEKLKASKELEKK